MFCFFRNFGLFRELLSLPWQGYIVNIIRSVPYSTESYPTSTGPAATLHGCRGEGRVLLKALGKMARKFLPLKTLIQFHKN